MDITLRISYYLWENMLSNKSTCCLFPARKKNCCQNGFKCIAINLAVRLYFRMGFYNNLRNYRRKPFCQSSQYRICFCRLPHACKSALCERGVESVEMESKAALQECVSKKLKFLVHVRS
eukprot:XP_001705537.1 Hypothetical protein GL50803_32030 [Giardia lamblia ATCC 50803]